MSTLQLPGLLSGIDTTTLISQLMAIERRTLEVYQSRQEVWESKKSTLNTLETKLSTLRSALRAISDSGKLRAFSTQSSDEEILTAEASYNAFEGNHTVVINRLATAEKWVHNTGVEYAEDYVGEGTFIYSYNHKESVLTTTAQTTLEDLVGLINNDAKNPGVTAGLLYYNGMYHLVLNGNEAGTDYEISINSSTTEVWQSDSEFTQGGSNATLSSKITGLDQFDDSKGSLVGNERIHITGTKHDGTAVDLYMDVTENTKLFHVIGEINDAFEGTATASLENGKIVLADHTSDTSLMTLELDYDPGTGQTDLNIPAIGRTTQGSPVSNILDAFGPDDFSETQSAQDSQIRVDGYPPGDWITKSSNTVDDVIHGVTLHLHNTTDENGAQITLTRDIASVKDKINSAVSAYNLVVNCIKENSSYNQTTKQAGILMGDYVVSNINSMIRTPLVTQTNGFIEDIDTFLNAAQIGLELDRDGLLNLDSSAFDKAIADDYLGVLALIGADKTGSSNSNTIEFYGASSRYTTAGNYDIKVIVSGGTKTAMIKLSTESEYRIANLSGNIITGNSSFDEAGRPVYAENGLQLSVDLSQITQDGTYTAQVRVKQGFAGAMEDALDKILQATSGSIKIDQSSADDAIGYLKERIELEEYRLEKREARLVARFARLESTLALIQSQMSALGFSTS